MENNKYRPLRAIISGGGTGGHIFPAISIANKLKELAPDTEILFVGATGKMEMEKVPAAGYRIVGLPIVGMQRQLTMKNVINDVQVPFRVMKSVSMAKKLSRAFRADIVVGVGGYASGPLLWAATGMKIPSLIQEQNSFAGVTNKLLGKRVQSICVAYEGMERFFPADKIVMSGNPIRKEVSTPPTAEMKAEAMAFYGLDPRKKHLFIVGGSLGSGTLNRSMKKWIEDGRPGGEDVEVIWQCGKYYKKGVDQFMEEHPCPGVQHHDFIARMDLAYAAADVVVTRSGASTVSELCAMGKAAIFVPSPNVAEDHQTHNAMALVRRDAALIVKDAEAPEKLLATAMDLLKDPERISTLEANAEKMALRDAAQVICDQAYKLARTKHVYFIGIGGIGMSALARYYHFKGYSVSGYDKTPSDLTAALQSEGIDVHYEDRPDLVPASVEDTLVIWTPAIHELRELDFVKKKGYRLVKRAFALGEVTKGKRCLAVAGTHGKTTTSTLTAHIFTENGEGCSAFLGGISRNYGTNLLVSDGPVVVAEADEFDRSFHCLHPEIAVVTAIDADHLDIYGDYAHVLEAFKIFASQVSGTLIAKYGIPLSAADTPARFLTYHYSDPAADFHPENVRTDPQGHFIYDLRHPGGLLEDVRVGTPGRVNAENSVAAAAIALSFGLDPQAVRQAIGTFQGVKRRLEVHVNKPGMAYVDDYAHHPAELAAAIASLRDIFPGRKITAIFQPHLYSRTRDFRAEFAEALSAVDKLILLPIYPAREEPIPGVTSETVLQDVTAPEKVLVQKEQLMEYLENEPVDVLVTFGAGNIDRFIGPITQLLESRR